MAVTVHYDFKNITVPGVDQSVIDRVGEQLGLWANKGILPGGFLTAVLENDLVGAIGCADTDNMRDLTQIVFLVSNAMPVGCWGSVEKVCNWEGASNNVV